MGGAGGAAGRAGGAAGTASGAGGTAGGAAFGGDPPRGLIVSPFAAARLVAPIGQRTLPIASVDIDADGWLDVAYGIYPDPPTGDGVVGVALNDHQGGFRPMVQTTFPPYLGVFFADVNSDGKADAIATTSDQTMVTIRLGLGDGRFSLASKWASVSPCGPSINRKVAIGDLNGDGKVDLVVSDSCTGPTPSVRVSVFSGDGTGSFPQPTMTETSGSARRSLLIRDVDQDGHPDVLVADLETVIFKNMGDGLLGPPTRHPLGMNIQVADMDGDGRPDLVGQVNDLLIAFNRGDGTFAEPITVAPCRSSLAVGDLNGDGRPDIACELESRGVQVLMNSGKGTFAAPLPLVGDGPPTAMADWDHDGDTDLIATQGAVVFFNEGGSLPTRTVRRSFPASTAIRLADLNGDGLQDIINVDRGRCRVFPGRTDGTFGDELVLPEFPLSGLPGVGDVNGDGKPDLAFTYIEPEGKVAVALNDGTARFATPTFFGAGPYAAEAAVVDLNRDGKGDVVARVAGGVAVLLNDGAGVLKAAVQYPIGDVRTMLTGNLDGGGAPDVIAASPEGVWVLLNQGDGTLAAPVKYGPGGGPLALLDINGDQRPEIAAATATDVIVLRNAGDGTFAAPVPIGGTNLAMTTNPLSPSALIAGRLNADQADDLVALYGDTVRTLFGDSSGAMWRGPVFWLRPSLPALAVGDLNEDGRTDLLIPRQ